MKLLIIVDLGTVEYGFEYFTSWSDVFDRTLELKANPEVLSYTITVVVEEVHK